MILTIQIPDNSHIIIKSGDMVNFDTPLFEIPSKSDHLISFAQKLGVDPSKIFHYLKKFVGEDVKKGDVLAIKKGILSEKKVKSDYDGKIKEIDHSEGNIIISTKDNKDTVNSYVMGEVIEIKAKKISIQVKEGKEYDLKKTSSDFGGKTFYLRNPVGNFSSNDIGGKILTTESLSSYNQSKMEALGIAGYITLLKLPEETNIPCCQLKTIEELKDIMKHIFTYCFIDSKSSKIIFYK